MSGKSLSPAARQALYKSSRQDWKETYRRRCLDRLRESRSELYAKRRGIGGAAQPTDSEGERQSDEFIKMVLSSELKTLKNEEGVDCEMDFFDPATGEIDLTLALIEEIQEEMKAEEAKLIAEYEIYQVSLEKEEAALCDAIELLNTRPICPVCTKSQLMENKGTIFCKCGVRIFTEDGVGLDFVQRQLEDGRQLHECDGQPVFSVHDQFGITNLLMTCQKCDFMYIVV
ncbi:RPA-interacting protein B-like isoform X2 [Babylonia areolata]|uniref:RPA-interacting protein B-like isoform X2 n=1 Tax=Babylonia areolata TaxID=304850 RepID=UPI003FD35B8C